jgi:cytochrome c oxidase cbb3-type subunit I/II
MYENEIDKASMPAKIRAMQKLGVPYPEGFDELAVADLEAQAAEVAARLKKDGIEADANKDIIALIAYLQRLGTDIKQKPATEVVQAQ